MLAGDILFLLSSSFVLPLTSEQICKSNCVTTLAFISSMSSLANDSTEMMKCQQVTTNNTCLVTVQISARTSKSHGTVTMTFATAPSNSRFNPFLAEYPQAKMVIKYSYYPKCSLDLTNYFPMLDLNFQLYCRQENDCSYIETHRLLTLYLQQWAKLDAWLRILLVGNSDNLNHLICWSSETKNQVQCLGGSKSNACMMDGEIRGCQNSTAIEIVKGFYKMTSIKLLSINNELQSTDLNNLSDLICTATLCNGDKTLDILNVVVGHFLNGINFPAPNSNETILTRPSTPYRLPSSTQITVNTTVGTTISRTTKMSTLSSQSNYSQQQCINGCAFTIPFRSVDMNNGTNLYQTSVCQTGLGDTCYSSISVDSVEIKVSNALYSSSMPINILTQKFPTATIVMEHRIEMFFHDQIEKNDLRVSIQLFCQGKHNCSTIETDRIVQSLINETSQLKTWLHNRFQRNNNQSPLPYIQCFSSQYNRIINCSLAFGCIMLVNGQRDCMSMSANAYIYCTGLTVDQQLRNVSFDPSFICTTNRCNDNATLTELKDRIQNYVSGKKQIWPEVSTATMLTLTKMESNVNMSKTLITTTITASLKEDKTSTSISTKNNWTDFLSGTSKAIVQRFQINIVIFIIFYVTIESNDPIQN